MPDTLQYYPSMHPHGARPSGKGRFLVCDTEWVGLLNTIRYNDPSSAHTFCIVDAFTGEDFVFFDPFEKRMPYARGLLEQEGQQDGYLADGLHMLMEAEGICFQNGVGFDFLAFDKAFPSTWQYNYIERRGKDRDQVGYFPVKCMDTMLLSQLLNPDRKAPGQAFALGRGNVGPHSIEAHGIRIGRHKPENEDWTMLTDHMIHRCLEDAHIGRDMFFWLMNGEWSEQVRRGRNPQSGLGIDSAYRMELQVAMTIGRQGQRGFRLDMPQAWSDWNAIGALMQETFQQISPHIPPRLVTEPMKHEHVVNRCAAYAKAFPTADVSWLRSHLQNCLSNNEQRIGKRTTMWSLTTVKGDYNKKLKTDYPEMVGNVNDTKDPMVAGPYTPITFEDIGLGNLDYIKQFVLYPQGWRGVTFNEDEEAFIEDDENNPEGEPPYPWSGKIDELSLTAWEERDGHVPEYLQGIVKWYVLRSRRSQILNPKDLDYFQEHKVWPKQVNGRCECRGLMARAFNKELNCEAQDFYARVGEWPTNPDEEWRVPATAFTIGTNTFRMRHRNVVNIPTRGLWPLRHLFIASKGYKILGCDGSGLELRMLAHFMSDAIYQEVVLNGDIHTHNQLLAGLPLRDMAKTFK